LKILLPFKKELNPYLEEIITYSSHDFKYDHYLNYNSSYDYVHIHWPEALFDWKEPTTAQLDELQICIKQWKLSSLLIYTKHDFQRNKGTTPNFTRLFNLVEVNTDVFIHLGNFTRTYYQKKYPLAKHKVVLHPLYKKTFNILSKDVARERLQISKSDLVIIVPGTIRNYAERDMIINAFNSLKFSDKVLICINMHSELRYDFPGRVKLKRFADVKKILINRFKRKHQPPKYIFTYETQSNHDLEVKMSASDLVFVPRHQTFNSGMVFLGFTFNKIVVGPSIGNIREQLKELKLPLFNPKSKSSVNTALLQGVELSKKHRYYPSCKMKKYAPKSVAEQMDVLMNSIL
jgi:hypothetical protein